MTEPYETGPFCAHWSDPPDCVQPCLRKDCKHPCNQHPLGECDVKDCPCKALMYEVNGEIAELNV